MFPVRSLFTLLLAWTPVVMLGSVKSLPVYGQGIQAKPVYRADFEGGFPNSAEWTGTFGIEDFTASGDPAADGITEDSAWTILSSDTDSAGNVVKPVSGQYMYKAWVWKQDDNTKNNGSFPLVHLDEVSPNYPEGIPSPLVNRFHVYLDWTESHPKHHWMHVATWGNNPNWRVVTLSVRGDGLLGLGHTEGFKLGSAAEKFPLRQWVEITTYIDYTEPGGLFCVWVNRNPALSGSGREASTPGDNLTRVHWGLYTNPDFNDGVQYNDDIQIWTLSERLPGCFSEPPSPYET